MRYSTPIACGFLALVIGCRCGHQPQPDPGPPTPPPTQPAPPPPPTDPLPSHGTVQELKHNDQATWYRVTWSQSFHFDPATAHLALEINTNDWIMGGKLVIANADDTQASPERTHNEPSANPTTDRLEIPPEKMTLTQQEREWVKSGSIRITIMNPLSKGRPLIKTVDLVPS